MKFPLTLSIAFPILIGTFIGIGGSVYVLDQTLNEIHTDEINYMGDNLAAELENSFSEVEHNIISGLSRLVDEDDFRKAVDNNQKKAALPNFIDLSTSALLVQPSLLYLNRGAEKSWLNSADIFGRDYSEELISLVEEHAVEQSGVIISTGSEGSKSHLLVISVQISAVDRFDYSGTIRAVYDFGSESALLDYIRTDANAGCIKIFANGAQSQWGGVENCNTELEQVFDPDLPDAEKTRKFLNTFVVAVNPASTYAYPTLQLAGAQKSLIREAHELQTFWTIFYVTTSVLLTGIISLFISSLFIRHSIKQLLTFIGRDNLDEEVIMPNFRISEFNAIGDTHAKSQNNLIDLNSKLRDTNREQSELTYAISHDMKSPMITILMLLRELEYAFEDTMDEDGAEILADLQKTSERMIALVDSILSYARSVGEKIEFDNVELSILLDDILSDLQGDITKANADIRVGNIPDITGNKVQIRMLLQNLISNALKFSDPSRTPIIEISGRVVSSSSYKQFELSIRDNGIGIAEEFQERVFGLFTRLHDYSAYQGSGIGLAVCQRVVNNHGGQIELTSQEGKGTTFKVVFPV